MIRRIGLKDPEDRMPYKHDPLNREDIQTLTRWIKEGAPWGEHWAYIAVKEPAVPRPTTFFGLINKKSDWAHNEVDDFIEQKWKEEDLKPSPQADKQTLLRRVSLDITGLLPSEKLAHKFLSDSSDHAYADLVDSLLASRHYGEKWTSMWLDLARYADTKGYERDDSRTIWKYRDWLIHAFNEDKPYDVFLKEQIAGDLLPDPTDDQYIATAFHRNTMTNDEGGTDNEEFRTTAVLDRVNTTWEAVMGTTFGCVQCHSHPYDPFKHDEYYKFMAFFNDTRDEDTEADYPLLRSYNDSLQEQVYALVHWIKENGSPEKAKEVYTFLKTWQPAYNSLTCDSFINSELADTKWLALTQSCSMSFEECGPAEKKISSFFDIRAWSLEVYGRFTWIRLTAQPSQRCHCKKQKDWMIRQVRIPTNIPSTVNRQPSSNLTGIHDLYFTYTNKNLKKPEDNGALFDWFYFTEELPGKDKPGYAEIKKQYEKLYAADVPPRR
ncbi:MAG: DUF1549 domain-containing protein [Puia sp.]